MKKFIVLFLLLLPFSMGIHSHILYDGWIKSDEPIIINNVSYSAIYIRNTNTTVVYFPEGISIVIKPWEDKCGEEWIYSVCQSGQRFEKNGTATLPDVRDHNIDIFLKLQINSSNAELIYSKNLSPVNYVGEKILVTAVIEKKGTSYSYDISDIKYTEIYSNDYDIEIVRGCIKKNRNLYWEAETMGNRHECVYYVSPLKEQNIDNMVVLSYSVLGKTKIKEYSEKIETKELPFSYQIIKKNEIKEIGKVSNFSLTIEPLADFTLDKIELAFPDSFSVLSEEIKNIKMNKSKKQEFVFILNNTYSGNYSIDAEIYYSYGLLKNKIRTSVDFEYYNREFSITLFQRNENNYIRINNPSNDGFSQISFFIGNHTYFFEYLGPKKFHEFLVDEATINNINVSYFTKYGQSKNENFILSSEKDSDFLIPEKDNKEKKSLNINIDIFLGVAGFIVISFILFKAFSMLKGKKSDLDKEIEEIRKKKL